MSDLQYVGVDIIWCLPLSAIMWNRLRGMGNMCRVRDIGGTI
jgi:hypothetical protein